MTITQTGGLEQMLKVTRNAPIVITCNHHLARHKEDGIVNGARAFIDSIQVSSKNKDEVEVIWVVFKDETVGRVLRYEFGHLKKLHKPNNMNAVPILKQKRSFTINSGEVRYQRTQFPMTLAYAITSYKCQGDTLDEVIIDFSHEAGERANIQWGSFYVALTRVKEGKNVYLKTFEESYITFNIKVENKIAAMREQKQYRFKKIYLSEKIFNDDEEIKLGYFNIRGFLESDHAKYLDHDFNLLRVNFLVISETWLNHETANHEVISKLKNWKIIKRLDATDNRKHMGILFLAPNSYTEYQDALFNLDYVEGYSKRKNNTLLYQGIIIELNIIYKRIVCLYIRETPNKEETNEISNRFRDFDCIMGDLNLNPAIPDQKSKLLAICGKDKMLALEEITTVFNNQLEHIILEKTLFDNCFATSFFNLASDHKPVVVRIGERMSNFTKEFKEKRNFDVDTNYYHEYKQRPNNAQEQSIKKKKTSLTEESNNN